MKRVDKLVALGYEGMPYFTDPDYDEAIVGVDDAGRVVYDYERMAQCLMDEDGMSYEDAIEFIEYNTIRTIPYMGEMAPVILHRIDELED